MWVNIHIMKCLNAAHLMDSSHKQEKMIYSMSPPTQTFVVFALKSLSSPQVQTSLKAQIKARPLSREDYPRARRARSTGRSNASDFFFLSSSSFRHGGIFFFEGARQELAGGALKRRCSDVPQQQIHHHYPRGSG